MKVIVTVWVDDKFRFGKYVNARRDPGLPSGLPPGLPQAEAF